MDNATMVNGTNGGIRSWMLLSSDLKGYIANPNVDLENLTEGQTVCIPDINLPCALPSSIVLRDGETLSSIAVTYNLPVAQLLRANPCLAPDDFTAGTTIKLPQ